MQRMHPKQINAIARLACIGESTVEITHELNNQLTALSGYTTIMREEEEWSKREEYIKKLASTAENCMRIAKGVLEFVRGVRTQKERRDLRRIVMKPLELKSAAFERDGIEVRSSFPEHGLEVMANEFQLQQVVLNIVHNAHYELLRVEERIFEVKGFRSGGRAVVEFTDSGRGLTDKDMNRAFDFFFTTKPTGEGTGLGLSISRSIVEEHGGKLWAERRGMRGATFVMELPLASDGYQFSDEGYKYIRRISSEKTKMSTLAPGNI